MADESAKTIRSRYKRDPAYDKPIRITNRDFEILKAVGDYRLLTAPQLQRLFFGSLPKCRKRLFELWQHKLLDRRFQPVRQNEGEAPILYTLSTQGARYLVAKQCFTGEAPAYTPFVSRGSSLFIDHTLRRNDFRVALTLACMRAPETKLLWWRQDQGIKQRVAVPDKRYGGTMRRVSVFADGQFSIEHQGRKLLYYVEIDLATVSSARMLMRFKGYYHLWLQKRSERGSHTSNFRVLVVTSLETRMRRLMETARAVAPVQAVAKPFWFATLDQSTSADRVLEPVWKGASDDATRYSLLGRPAQLSPTPDGASQSARVPA